MPAAERGGADAAAAHTHQYWAAFLASAILAWTLLNHLPQDPAKPNATGESFEVVGLTLHNVSRGYNQYDTWGTQCSSDPPPRKPARDPKRSDAMQYTPNRAWPRSARDTRMLILLAVDNAQAANASDLARTFSTWMQHLAPAVAHNTALAMLLEEQISSGGVETLTAALQLRALNCSEEVRSAACKVAAGLDQGYALHAAGLDGGRSLAVFVGVHHFEAPYWLQRQGQTEGMLAEQGWRTEVCSEPYSRWKTRSWWQLAAFRLQLLDYFHFFLRVDATVAFLKPLPLDLAALMARKRAVFLHTGTAEDMQDCQGELGNLTAHYLDVESDRCGHLVQAVAEAEVWFQHLNHFHWLTDFVAGDLGFFTSSEQLHFAAALHNSPYNQKHPWADQGYFVATLGLFMDGSYILDQSQLRKEKVFS